MLSGILSPAFTFCGTPVAGVDKKAIIGLILIYKTWNELKSSFADIKPNGLFYSIFKTSTINKSAINTYNKAIAEVTNNCASMAKKQQIMKLRKEIVND